MHLPDFSLPITDPVLTFALVMVMILVLPLLVRRFRLPGLVGLLVAGMIIGPHALGVLARDQTMQLLGTVGILYIMFIAGLEVDLNEFSRHRNRSILFGAMTFALPQGLGTLVGRFVLEFDWAGSVLLGAVFASHTLLAYPIISRLGLAKSEAVTTSVGATILTDTAALLVLAVVVRAVEGALTLLFWVQMLVLLGAYVAAVLWSVPRLGRWFFRKVRSDGEAEFVFVLAVVFVCAFLATMVGVEPIIGAFLAGLALNRLVPEQSTLMSRTRFVGESLFIPFFLLSVGMLVDLGVLAGGPRAWLIAGSMVGTVALTKWLAAASTRPLFGYTADQAWMIFGLTIPQAAATLATVLIGFNVGIFDENVLNGSILMILVTCMIGPWIAERYGRRVAQQAEQAPFEPSQLPQRILVPLANPETAPLLIDVAFMIRRPTSDQPIFPLAIVEDEDDVQRGVAAGEKLLGHAVLHAAAADVPSIPVVRIDRNVASGILRAIRERMISTVVIGWNGKSTGRHSTFGSILDQLLAESRELVLVSKIEQPLNTVQRIVAIVPPYAYLEPGFADVMQLVKVLAGQVGAHLLVLSVDDNLEAVETRISGLRPDVPTSFRAVPVWTRLLPVLEAEYRAHDLFLFAAAREGTIPWRPAHEQLLRQLSRRFPDANLIVCYPPLAPSEAEPAFVRSLRSHVLGDLISAEHITLDLEGGRAEEALEHLLRPAFEARPGSLRETIDALLQMRADQAPELLPGVVLYHTHTPVVEAPRLNVGISRPGLRLAQHAGPVHLVLVLLSPEGDAPERHLRTLAQVARLVRSEATIEELRAAASADEAHAIFERALRAPRDASPRDARG